MDIQTNDNIYKSLLETFPQKIFYKDVNSVYVFCNQNYADDLHINPIDICGKTDFDFYPHELAEKYRSEDRQIMDSGISQEFDEDFMAPGGKSAIVHTMKTPCKNEQGDIVGVVGMFWDVTTSKMTEFALQKQAQEFVEIINHFPEVMYVSDPYTKEILLVSKTFEEMLGHDPVGKKCYKEIQCLDSVCEFCTDPIILKTRKPYTWEYYNPTLKKHFYIKDQILQWPGGRDVRFEVAIDITEKKEAENALKDRVKELDCLYHISKIVDQEDFTIEEIMQSIVDVIPSAMQYPEFTCSRIQISNQIFQSTNFEESTCRLSSHIHKNGDQYGNVEVFYRELHENSDKHPFLQEERNLIDIIAERIGKIIEKHNSEIAIEKYKNDLEDLVQKQNNEIEKRKKTEDELRKSEDLFRKYFDLGRIGMAMTSVEKGWLNVNNHLCTMLGYSRDELMMMTWAELTHPDDLEPDIQQFNELLSGQIDSYSMDKRFIHKNGKIVYTFLSVSCVRHNDNTVDYVIAHLQDITDKKKAEFALEKRTKELKQSNKDLEQFAYVASHDLQEPIRKVSSFTELLVKKFPDLIDEKAQKYVDYILDGAKRMQRLIQDLLLYSRAGRTNIEMKEIEINLLLNQVREDLSNKISLMNAKVTIENMPVITANQTGLYQVFLNLISNAIKFNESDSPHVTVSAERREKEWLFCVADNGIGIDPKYQERIFTIFQRLHSRDQYSGTGIGLSVCKKIIEECGGRIWIDSEFGNGSSFYFSIPDLQEDKY
jgi:PAS domain S-box-containing protein